MFALQFILKLLHIYTSQFVVNSGLLGPLNCRILNWIFFALTVVLIVASFNRMSTFALKIVTQKNFHAHLQNFNTVLKGTCY